MSDDICDVRVCMMCVCRTSAILFGPSKAYRCSHWSLSISKGQIFYILTLTRILGPSYVEDLGPPAMMGFEPTTPWSTTSLTSRTPPLLANLKVHNFRQWHQSVFSNPWRSVSISKSHMFIQHSWLAKLRISNCCAERTWGNHEVTFSVNSEWWSRWKLDDYCIT